MNRRRLGRFPAGYLLLLSALAFCLALGPREAVSAEGLLDAGGREAVLREIRQRQGKMEAVSLSIHQTRELMLLEKTIEIEGLVILKRPNLLRWETSAPERSVTVLDEERMTVYRPDQKEAEIFDISAHVIARNSMRFFASAMWGSLEDMEKTFESVVSERGGEIVFELRPLSSIVSRYLSIVTISYSMETGLPTALETRTPRGDRTLTRILSASINPELPPEAFKVRLPSDTHVLDHTEKIDF